MENIASEIEGEPSNDPEGNQAVPLKLAESATAPKKASTRKRRTSTKRKRKPKARAGQAEQKRTRIQRSFPSSTFEEALPLAQAIQKFAAGQRVRRLTLFDDLKKSPDSSTSRQLITNSAKYGLTKGSYAAEHLELTEDGRIASNPDVSGRERLRARFKLAIEQIPPFKALYDQFEGNKLPAQAVLRDFLLEQGYGADEAPECVDTFILNAKFLGILKTYAGAERLLPIDHALEEAPTRSDGGTQLGTTPDVVTPTGAPASGETTDWSKICFYITPIGAPDSEVRRHSDLFLSHIVEPAVEKFGLKVVRADHIGKPGMITAQVIEHVIKAGLVIADLSFHNPNVFYELSLRHSRGLPTVQLIRTEDELPFDLDQVRTIQIDTSSIYTLVPQIETYKSEIATQVRRALEDPESVGNPLTVFYPGLLTGTPDGAR